MSLHIDTIELNFHGLPLRLEVEWEWDPPQARTWDCPEWPGSVEVIEVAVLYPDGSRADIDASDDLKEAATIAIEEQVRL